MVDVHKLTVLIDEAVFNSSEDAGVNLTYVYAELDKLKEAIAKIEADANQAGLELAGCREQLGQAQVKLAAIRLVLNSPGV